MLELEGFLAFKLDPGGCSFSWLAVEPVLIVMKRGYPTLESLGQNLQSKPHKTKPRNPKPLNSEALEPRSRKPSINTHYLEPYTLFLRAQEGSWQVSSPQEAQLPKTPKPEP